MDRAVCTKCTMSFARSDPPDGAVDRMICPECGQVFWYRDGAKVRCGIIPGKQIRMETL